MNSIININTLIKEGIDRNNYIESLIEILFNYNLISEDEINIIRDKLVLLLLDRLKKYTGGINNTVSLSIAKSINRSCMWTLGIYLNNFEPKQSLETLLNENILDIYNKGNNEIDSLINKTKMFYNTIFLDNLIENDNYFYNATLKEGIKGFFKLYNKDYDVCNTIINFDYESFIRRNKNFGIECIKEYLNAIHSENSFCKCFDNKKVKYLLEKIPNYQNIPINIYETILITAVMLEYLNIDPFLLSVNDLDSNILYRDLNDSKNEYIFKLNNSYNKLIEKCDVSKNTHNYLVSSKKKIIDIILSATCNKRLDILLHKDQRKYINYYFYPKMDDNTYIKFIKELNNKEDKISYILTKVNSLLDIIDLLEDVTFNNQELYRLFNSLSIVEIMVLKQYFAGVDINVNDVINSYIMTKNKNEIKIILDNYQYISSIKQNDII